MPKPNRHLGNPVFIGVDPGVNGGIAVIDNSEINLYYMPETEYDTFTLFRRIGLTDDGRGYKCRIARIEEVNRGFPGSSKAAIAKLYGSYCSLRMAMIGNGMSLDHVRSQDWQQGLGIRRKDKNESYNKCKDYLRGRAQALFPTLAIWDRDKTSQRAVCDALLIACYCQRKWRGEIK
jgi:hypothetical protein